MSVKFQINKNILFTKPNWPIKNINWLISIRLCWLHNKLFSIN